MAERTYKVYECDKCGQPGKRYTVLFDDGTKILDRCERHNQVIEKLREEPGDFVQTGPARGVFKKSSAEDIRLSVAREVQQQASGK